MNELLIDLASDTFVIRRFVIRRAICALIAILFCSCQGRQVQNSPVQIDPPAQAATEHQAEKEKALKGLEDKEAEARRDAIDALVNIGAKEYAKDIAGHLKDENAGVRFHAVNALVKLGAKEYAKDIVEFLKDRNWRVRLNAVRALGELGAKEYAKDIAQHLKDEGTYVRGVAAWALGKLGAKEYTTISLKF